MREVIPPSVLEVQEKLSSLGFPSYFVGGCVRDFLLEEVPKDWDICTQAKPSEILEFFSDSVTLGAKYGTIGVKTPNGVVEVTTFRTESNYKDFRHPEICFCSSLEEDLKRRDFSINSIAYSPSEGYIDPFGGMQDLKSKTLKCIGEAKERLSEDALRILRLVRFCSRLDFTPEKHTLSSAIELTPLLSHISNERIRDELLKIFQTSFWSKYYSIFAPIFSFVLPELKKPFKHKFSNLSLLFAYIFQEPKDLEALQRLKIDKITSKRAALLLEHKKTEIIPEKVEIKLMLKALGYDNFTALLELQKLIGKDTKKIYKTLQNIMIADECYSLKDLKVNGNDLLALGLKGKKIKEALENLLDRVIRGEIPNDKEKLIEVLS